MRDRHHTQGHTVTKIAEAWKVTPTAMSTAMRAAGITIRTDLRGVNARDTSFDELIVRDYLAGDPLLPLVDRYGMEQRAVEYALRVSGHKPRTKTEAAALRRQQTVAADAARYALREGALARVAEKAGVDEATLRAALDAEGLLLHDLDQ
ncbi:hypothetical protein [Streptomyces sp. NBC_00470]|uniref:hypothetical protein n=1 Tax=Streptomyces sp. NBC_00470 TaxID=2975753 RepID=UPI0030E2F9D8